MYIEKKEAGGEALPAEIKEKFNEVMSAVTELRKKNDEAISETKKGFEDVVRKEELKRIDLVIQELKDSVNKSIAQLKRPLLGGTALETPELTDYSKKFAAFFRKGEDDPEVGGKNSLRDLEKKAMQTQSNPDGGFTVRPEMENAIDAVLKEVSPIRQIATVQPISANSYKKLVSQRGATSGWVGETDSRPQTNTSQLSELEFPVAELYAMPAATQTLLDDSYVNIDQWIADEVAVEFAQKEGAAFVAGDGVKKPRGFLAYPTVANASYAWGSVGYIATGVSGDFAASNKADALINLIYAVKDGYRAGSSFVTNRSLLGEIRLIKDGQGNYIAGPRLSDDGLIETIFNFPLTEAEDMPVKAANSLSLAFGNFKRGYLIVDRVGTQVLRDPYSAKPYVLFYTTKRVGGGIQNFEAFKLLKFAVS